MPRDYKHYLQDIVEYAQAIDEALGGLPQDDFASNRVLRAAIERYIEIIGEAAKSIPDDVKERYPAHWRQAARMRDVLIHNYPGIVDKIVWDTAVNDIPPLAEAAAQALRDLAQPE